MKAKSGMQQSIIAGILLRSVSMKSFARAPSSPIFSFTCFSNHFANGDFFSPLAPTVKCIGAFAFGVGTGTIGGADGRSGAGGGAGGARGRGAHRRGGGVVWVGDV